MLPEHSLDKCFDRHVMIKSRLYYVRNNQTVLTCFLFRSCNLPVPVSLAFLTFFS